MLLSALQVGMHAGAQGPRVQAAGGLAASPAWRAATPVVSA
jgi:hypothetical protein